MTIAYCGAAILATSLLLLVLFSLRGSRSAGVAVFLTAIAFVVLIGDVHFTGNRQVALVACGTSATAAEQTTLCPFK